MRRIPSIFPVRRPFLQALVAVALPLFFGLSASGDQTKAPDAPEVSFQPTKYRNVTVRHIPGSADKKLTELPKPGTPRTPFKMQKLPNGTEVFHPDNTYITPEPVPSKPAAVTKPVENTSKPVSK